MGKYAVVIGLNYEEDPNNVLRGPCRDARAVRKFLLSRGFLDSNIKLLVDDCDKRCVPDRRRVTAALNWLCSGRQAGDIVFLHFSGHGCQIADTDGDEEDGYDETICLHEMDLMLDDELRQFFSRLPAGAHATAVVDSCSSGTILDHKTVVIGKTTKRPMSECKARRKARPPQAASRTVRAVPVSRVAARLSERVGRAVAPTKHSIGAAMAQLHGPASSKLAMEYAVREIQRRRLAGGRSVSELQAMVRDGAKMAELGLQSRVAPGGRAPVYEPADGYVDENVCVAITGCQPREYSFETEIKGKRRGTLTYLLLQVAKENPCISNYDLVMEVRRRLHCMDAVLNYRTTQRPGLETSKTLAHKTFLTHE